MWFHVTQRLLKIFEIIILVAFFATIVYATEALKNHAPEKRQDDSFLFFGGWRPIKPGSRYHHRSATGKYHDLLSVIPEPLDTSSTYYSSSHSGYNKDIYNYYPRPAIRSRIKGKAPVYMESLKRRRNPQQGKKVPELQIPSLHGINVEHIKGLHEILLQRIPYSQLTSIPLQGGKVVELAVQPVGLSSSGGHYSTSGGISYLPNQPTDVKSSIEYALPKSLPLVPVNLPEVEEALDLKNIQIVEIPVPVHSGGASKSKSVSRYDKRGNKGSNGGRRAHYSTLKSQVPQTRHVESLILPGYNLPQQYSSPPVRKHQPSSYGRKQQSAEIAAELISINDDQIKHLLKNIQIVDKNSNDILRYLPLTEIKEEKNENLHFVVTVPESHTSQQGHSGAQEGHYQARSPSNEESKHSGYQEIQLQVLDDSQQHHGGYEPKNHQTNDIPAQNGGYQVIEVQGNDGYQVEDAYNQENQYQHEEKHVQYHQQGRGGGYQQADYGGHEQQSRYGGHEQQSRYGGHEQQSRYGGHGQQSRYGGHEQQSRYGGHQQQAKYSGHEQQGGHQQNQPQIISYQKDNHGQAYIEVNAHIDENGYRREPVLAVELQKGQTVEDAIKALDAETLQKLGASTKDGVEIEVVEIPVDEYGAESKKKETIVPLKDSTNSTITTATTTTTTTTTTTEKPSKKTS